MQACTHLDQIRDVEPSAEGCEDWDEELLRVAEAVKASGDRSRCSSRPGYPSTRSPGPLSCSLEKFQEVTHLSDTPRPDRKYDAIVTNTHGGAAVKALSLPERRSEG